MATDLTSELRQAIEAANGRPVEIVDAKTNEKFILLRSEVYDQLKSSILQDDWSPRRMYDTMAKVMEDDWSDPRMDSYDGQP